MGQRSRAAFLLRRIQNLSKAGKAGQMSVVNIIHIIPRLARLHRVHPPVIYSFGLPCNARPSAFSCQSKKLSAAAMSTRVRSPTSDPEVPAPLEKKMRLEEHTMDTSNETKKRIDDSVLAAPGPSKKASKIAKRKQKHVLPEPYSSDDVLWRDVVALLGNDTVEHALQQGTEWDPPFDYHHEVEVEVSKLSSNGANTDVRSLFVKFD